MQRLGASTRARSLHRLSCGNAAEHAEARASVLVVAHTITTTTTHTRSLRTHLAPVIRAAADLEPFDYDPRGAGRIGARDVRFCSAASVSKRDTTHHDASSFTPVCSPSAPSGSSHDQCGMLGSHVSMRRPMCNSSCEPGPLSMVCPGAWSPIVHSTAHADMSQQHGKVTHRHEMGYQADAIVTWLLSSNDVHADAPDTTRKHRNTARDGRPYPSTAAARMISHGKDHALSTSSDSQQSTTNNADSCYRTSSDVTCWPVP